MQAPASTYRIRPETHDIRIEPRDVRIANHKANRKGQTPQASLVHAAFLGVEQCVHGGRQSH